jgi:formylglycine-generating enzyme required for sulfatase activity
MEFCARLSQRMGRTYTLPSEAQWEYACRAGTSSPFHFGETITTTLANYDGNYAYGDGPKGENRQQTTPVGSFPANAWGLQDMHGNVWEWCQDWHTVGSYRVDRGGSWSEKAKVCRSAGRFGYQPSFRLGSMGFRVASAPPDE